jgi:ATP-dependent helicase/nuclease subunit B
MSVRFILGRAGSGKTHHCLTSIRSQLASDPVDGPPLILLVPEQASFQAERAIVEATGDGGGALASHRAEVLSFQRLAFRILDNVGAPPRTALSDAARAMVLRHLIAREAPKLQYYRRVERAAGWIDRISATIAELIQEAVDPEALAEVGGEDDSDDDPATKLKLGDLRVIYQAYLDYLGEDRVDPSQYLAVARSHLGGCDWVSGAHLWVDGFASMSEQEVLTLVDLAKKCATAEITVLVDPSVVDQSVVSGSKRSSKQLFSRIEETYRSLRGRLLEAGLVEEAPVVLDPAEMPRFRGCGSLAAIEGRLFGRGDGGELTCDGDADRVEVVELPSRRVEVDYAVSKVCDWVSDESSGLRYRDIAIIVRDLEPYHDLLSDALAASEIPFFIDRRRPLSHHPIVELVRALVQVGSRGFSLESVRMLLKTDLLPIDRAAADALENYLIAYGLEGVSAWSGDDWDKRMPETRRPHNEATDADTCPRLKRVNETRREVYAAIEPWVAVCMKEGSRTGAEWSAAIRIALTRLGSGSSLAKWAHDAEEMGELATAEEHRQVWGDLSAFLDDLAFAFDEVSLSVDELGDVLESGLSVLSAGLVPPSLDQVLVGSIERSRHPDIKAAVVLGFNDGVFPAKLGEDSILNDDDRIALRDSGISVAAPARERVMEESLLVYIAMTRASDRLSVTYTKTDDSGKTMRASPYVDALTGAIDGLCVCEVADPMRSGDVWDIHCAGDLRRRLVGEFRGRGDAKEARAIWNTIYDRCRTSLLEDRLMQIAVRSLGEERLPELSEATAKSLYNLPLRTSVSQLEAYASCPFKHFSKYALGLRERAEAVLEVTDVGTVHHAILERVVDQMRDQKCAMGDWTEEQLDGAIAAACSAVVEHGGLDETSSYARDEYILRRSAERVSRVMRFQRKAAGVGRAKPAAAELAYGYDEEDSLPALTIDTPKGRKVRLRGFIDRVDIAEIGDELLGVVVDYKRTRDKKLDLSHVYHGLSLQLPAYLLALQEAKRTPAGRPIRPIGALYVSLATSYSTVGHPSEADEFGEQKQHGLSKPRGLLLETELKVLDASLSEGRSEYYNVFVKKDGTLGNRDRSDAVMADEFQATLEHTKQELGTIADAMLDGCVAVAPYRLGKTGPCDWCEMRDVCRHEEVTSRTRFLEKKNRVDVLSEMVNEIE